MGCSSSEANGDGEAASGGAQDTAVTQISPLQPHGNVVAKRC